MTGPKGICRKCGETIHSNERAAYAVQGYEVERDAGGQNHVRERRRMDGWVWHERYEGDCFDLWLKQRKGTGVQETLI